MASSPPSGDPAQAEKYINQLISLIDLDKLDVFHTDLTRFDPTNLQDHYQMELQEYKLEVSHSKHPSSGKDSYVLVFTNIKNVADGNSEKIILAYMHLDDSQFMRVRRAFLEQESRKKKMEEERRLKEALKPVDQVLDHISEQALAVSTAAPAVS